MDNFQRDTSKNFFTLPNEIFLLHLPHSAFMVYAYLLLIENRRTHTCHPSYNTIAAGTGLSKNTAMKAINVLLEEDLVTMEHSQYFDKHGMKWKGNNLYTILPMQLAMDAFYQRQFQQIEQTKRSRIKARRLTAARQPTTARGAGGSRDLTMGSQLGYTAGNEVTGGLNRPVPALCDDVFGQNEGVL